MDRPISAVGRAASITSAKLACWPGRLLATAPAGWARRRWAGLRSARPTVSSPCTLTTKIRARASASDRPSATIDRTICSQTPMPAEPAPSMTTCCSRGRDPLARAAAASAATATAAVPWMSSLNVSSWSR